MVIVAHFESAIDIPLTAPGATPTIRIRRTDTQALVVTDLAMTEQGDGNFSFDFTPVDGLEYAVRADGDPTAIGQTVPGGRFAYGAFSGTTEARLETDIPAILTAANVAQVDVRQTWSRALPDAFTGVVHIEANGERVTLPGGATLGYQAYASDGTSIPGFSGAGTLRTSGADTWFELTATFVPTAGTVVTVRCTITGSGIGSGTHNGMTEISFPEF